MNASTGTVAQRIDYEEFGEVTYNLNPGFQHFGFDGGLMDNATGLFRYGTRDYDAKVGRWTAKEPLGFIGSKNFYIYADQDPINFVDPTGLKKKGTDKECDDIANKINNIVNAIIEKKYQYNEDIFNFEKTGLANRVSQLKTIKRLEKSLQKQSDKYYEQCSDDDWPGLKLPEITAIDPQAVNDATYLAFILLLIRIAAVLAL